MLTGVFQLDTASARELLVTLCPKSFSELTIFLALNRPGILPSVKRKIVKEINRKIIDKKESLFMTPKIKQILAESYGYIIFEEQLSQVLALVYDYSFAEAEIRRRELLEKPLGRDFLVRAQKKMTPPEAQLIYGQINSIIGYTFNKAHAVAYGYLTYYIAYLKANFFQEIIVHLLNEKKEKSLPYLQEAFF